TPGYMPPEQARGQRVGPPADVYALGAILYECLAGSPPFVTGSPLEILARVLSEEVPSVSGQGRPVPRDLASVCHRCLEKDAARRYQSAEALADDLARFLGGNPVRARPVGTAERAWKWAGRHPAIAALSSSVAVLILVGFVVAW